MQCCFLHFCAAAPSRARGRLLSPGLGTRSSASCSAPCPPRALHQLDKVRLRLAQRVGDGSLCVADALVEAVDLHQPGDLVPDLVDVVAEFPLQFYAQQNADPLVETVPDVRREAHVRRPDLPAALVEVECAFRHFQLVAVLVEAGQEEGDEAHEDLEEAADLGDQVVEFADRPLIQSYKIFTLPISPLES